MTAPDITVGFATRGGTLYAGILRQGTVRMQILRTAAITGVTPMTVLVDRNVEDQPWVVAGSVVVNGPLASTACMSAARTRSRGPRLRAWRPARPVARRWPPPPRPPASARLPARHLLGGSSALPADPLRNPLRRYRVCRIPARHAAGRRPGWLGLRLRRRRPGVTTDGATNPGAVLGAQGARAGDPPASRRRERPLPRASTTSLGQERLGADLAIAVHPNNSAIVYVAFCYRPRRRVRQRVDAASGRSRLRGLRRLVDRAALRRPRGQEPGARRELHGRTRRHSPTSSSPYGRWITKLELTKRLVGNAARDARPAPGAGQNVPARAFLPYIGDYIRLFSPSTPTSTVCSPATTLRTWRTSRTVSRYQRNANFTTRTLLDSSTASRRWRFRSTRSSSTGRA